MVDSGAELHQPRSELDQLRAACGSERRLLTVRVAAAGVTSMLSYSGRHELMRG